MAIPNFGQMMSSERAQLRTEVSGNAIMFLGHFSRNER